MRRFILALVLSLLASDLSADTAFQAVEERAHFTFRYPSGRSRLLSDGSQIVLMNRAWSDTLGRGRSYNYYYSFLDEYGDSVGVWIWTTSTDSIPPGKYFFVEQSGPDSTFGVPDFFRLSFDMAAPQSVDSSAVIAQEIKTVHLDPDSIISSPALIKSGVVRNVHLFSGLNGAKISSGTIGSTQLAAGAARANLFVAGLADLTGFALGLPDSGRIRLDSLDVDVIARINTLNVNSGSMIANDAAVILTVPLEADSIHAGDGIRTEGLLYAAGTGSDLRGNVSTGTGLTSVFTARGTVHANNDLESGDDVSVGDDLDVNRTASIGDSTLLGLDYGAADSLATAAQITGWIVHDGTYLFQDTLAAGTLSAVFKVPGARTWDTLVFATPATNTVAPGAASNSPLANVTGVGEITITRGSSTGDVTYNILVLKRR